MEILVCIKQVPETNEVEVDEQTGVLKREGIDSKMNPYDLYAIETALKLKEEYGGRVTVITMGPPQANAIIKEAFMMGADAGYILSDRRFAGADTLATGYTLAQGVRKVEEFAGISGGFDLLICGMQTTDGDTAQVGPAVAELLGIPHVAYVNRVLGATPQTLTVQQDMADSVEIAEVSFPALITVTKEVNQPRLPSFRRKLETKDWEIKMFSLNDFADRAEEHYGLKGSPTQVERIFPPESNTEKTVWQGVGDDLAGRIYSKLKELKFV